MNSCLSGVATVTLNPAIDHSIGLADFTPGALNRVVWEQLEAGGKGVNVASLLADLGLRVAVTGLLGEEGAEPFTRQFSERGIVDAFVRVSGKVRVNLKLVDLRTGEVSEVNFPGIAPRADDLVRLKSALDGLLAENDCIVVAGSLPPGLPASYCRDLVLHLQAAGMRVVVDGSGEALRLAIDATPWMIKPNVAELEDLVGEKLPQQKARLRAARRLHERGVTHVVVSMGPAGALFVSGEQALHAQPPAVEIKTTVGAGDALVAGFLAGERRGAPLAACARLATACALARITCPNARLSASAIDDWARRVQVSPIGDD